MTRSFLLTQSSASAVDMSFKISVRYQLCDEELLKNGHCAGIKSELFLKQRQKSFGKDRVSYAEWRRDRSWKGVHIDHRAVFRKREKRILVFGGNGKLGWVIVLYYYDVMLGGKSQIFAPFGCGGGHSARIAVKRGNVKHSGPWSRPCGLKELRREADKPRYRKRKWSEAQR